MPRERRAGYVSDPIHGYIPFTRLEREIFDQRATQRLRRVSQTGLGNLVYPELTSSRFTHCLGTMHLSSQFLAACIRNSDAVIQSELLDGIVKAVEYRFGYRDSNFAPPPLPEVYREDIALQARVWVEMGKFNGAGSEVQELLQRYDHRKRAVAIAEQALRLAALFHDLGHLPFSHDFEFALGALRNDRDLPLNLKQKMDSLWRDLESIEVSKFHEVLGPEVGHLILRKVLMDHERESGDGDHHRDLQTQLYRVFDVAYDIWTATAVSEEPSDIAASSPVDDRSRALGWMKSLISGELDVDRCDYILRDGRNYGFDFAGFDLKRLLGQLVVARAPSGNGYVLAVRPQGISFLESFVEARYRSYHYGVLHHKVSQVAAALQYAIEKLLKDFYYDGQNEVGYFLDDLASFIHYRQRRKDGDLAPDLVHDESELLRRFARYDDNWWTELMRRNFGLKSEDPWVNLVLWREPGPRSLWKRPDDFMHLLGASINAASTSDDTEFTQSLPNGLRQWNADLPAIPDHEAPWSEVVRELRSKDRVLVLRKRVKPFEVDSGGDSVGLYVQSQTEGVKPLTQLSPVTRALRDAWQEDIQVHAFLGEDSDQETPEEVATRVILGLWRVMPHSPARTMEGKHDE